MTRNGVVCRVCGDEFMFKKKFCSKDCARTYYLDQQTLAAGNVNRDFQDEEEII